MLAGLARHGPRAFANALQMVNHKLRLMYVHAYQSALWNRAAAARAAAWGLEAAVEGDLVKLPAEPEAPAEAGDGAAPPRGRPVGGRMSQVKVQRVTAEEAAAGTFHRRARASPHI